MTKKGKRLAAVRGMFDIFPAQAKQYRALMATMADLAESYGFAEIITPLVENLELFQRSVGETSDIVSKEMFAFEDRKGRLLALRPEGTASVTRALHAGDLDPRGENKLWYTGPMFRYERPQQGRQRQFMQFGVEHYGSADWTADIELLQLTADIFAKLGILANLTLRVNFLGDEQTLAAYNESLRDWALQVQEKLDPDSQMRITKNPLRILDSKIPATRALLEGAPKLEECLSSPEKDRLKAIIEEMQEVCDVQYDTCLVRGLDYYNGLVFEWVSDAIGAQDAVCGGGRFDRLSEQLGNRPTPAIGFSIGVDRLLQTLQKIQPKWHIDHTQKECVILITYVNSTDSEQAVMQRLTWRLANKLRQALQRKSNEEMGGQSARYTVKIVRKMSQKSVKEANSHKDFQNVTGGGIVAIDGVKREILAVGVGDMKRVTDWKYSIQSDTTSITGALDRELDILVREFTHEYSR